MNNDQLKENICKEAIVFKLIINFLQSLKALMNIDQVRKIFPFIPVNWAEQNPNKWTLNQVWDFHLDWTENTHSIMIVIEEFGKMDERWKIEILKDYLTTSYNQEKPNKAYLNFQLIITQQEEDGLVDKLCSALCLRENEKRTPKQFILGKLSVVNLDLIKT